MMVKEYHQCNLYCIRSSYYGIASVDSRTFLVAVLHLDHKIL